MNEETQVAPDAATQISAPETVETPEVTTPDAEGQEPQQEKPQLSDAEREAKALKRRVDRLTQQKYQLAAEVENLRRRPAEQEDPTREPVENDPARFAERLMAQRLDTVESAVKKAVGASYDDFIDDLRSAGPAAGAFLRTALELDDSHKVLAHLASDRDELDKVLQMRGAKQAAYLGALSERLETKKTPSVSTAPKPLTPLTSRTTARSVPALGDEDLVRAIRASR